MGGGRVVARPRPADEPRRRGRALGPCARDGPAAGAFYALDGGGWRDYWTLLHPPYTLWHLSFVAIGACMVPVIRPAYLGLAILAFFLAVGIAAHALDELRGRPLRTRISNRILVGLAALALLGAAVVGIYGASLVSWWGLLFIGVGGFLVPAYNLEWFHGTFHSDLWFAIMWGGFPALAGAFAQMGRINVATLFVCTGCALIAAAQRRLSTPGPADPPPGHVGVGGPRGGGRVGTDHRSHDHGRARGSAAAHVDRDGGPGAGSRDQPMAVGLLSRRSSGSAAARP